MNKAKASWHLEWHVVAALVVGHTLANARHNKVLQLLGEALEEA
jgi:hypothetical protein